MGFYFYTLFAPLLYKFTQFYSTEQIYFSKLLTSETYHKSNTVEKTEIHRLIKESGMSVPKISEATKIPPSTIYGWLKRGSKPSYEDSVKIIAFFKSKEMKLNSAVDSVLAVLLDRVAELLAVKNGTSAVVEREKMQRDAEFLKGDK